MDTPSLLLASNSPRRRELLALGGWTFGVAVSNLDESRSPGEAPGDYVRRLAGQKARAALPHAGPAQVIVGADTAVIIDADVLGKPADRDEATAMLRRLRGRTHQVFTGIAGLRARDGTMLTDVCVTDVPMRAYSDEEIEAYVATGDPLDKAGAYAIQHARFDPVAAMSGCYAGVMGLPLCHLTRLLNGLQAPPAEDVPANCQSFLNYRCPVWRAILRGGAAG